MILAICFSVLAVLSILGLSEIIFAIKLFNLNDSQDYSRFLLLLLNREDYCFQLVCAIEKMNWYGNLYDGIYAITDNLNCCQIEDCEEIVASYKTDNVYLGNKEKISIILNV